MDGHLCMCDIFDIFNYKRFGCVWVCVCDIKLLKVFTCFTILIFFGFFQLKLVTDTNNTSLRSIHITHLVIASSYLLLLIFLVSSSVALCLYMYVCLPYTLVSHTSFHKENYVILKWHYYPVEICRHELHRWYDKLARSAYNIGLIPGGKCCRIGCWKETMNELIILNI